MGGSDNQHSLVEIENEGADYQDNLGIRLAKLGVRGESIESSIDLDWG